jgi:hypothetical protein
MQVGKIETGAPVINHTFGAGMAHADHANLVVAMHHFAVNRSNKVISAIH